MKSHFRRTACMVAALIAVGMVLPVAAAGQDLPRTPWGDPDLQGIWSNTTTTPLQRPEELADRTTLTDEERAERDAERAANADRPPPPGQTGAYNSFWFERGFTGEQTSLVVDPPSGQLPPLTPPAAARAEAIHTVRYSDRRDWTTDFHLYDRCLTRALPGSMMPGFYNHNYNILQTPDHVVIQVEMIHDSRIVPLDGRPQIDPSIQQWLGSSRGRWEGDTLVVETTNLSAKANEQRVEMANVVFGIGENARLVERFTRIDYQVTVHDPTTYQSAWTVSMPMVAIEGPLFEYACHEGNYALRNMLSGARADEAAAAAAQK
ncbi:MAG: hypothetical protein J4F30_07435 [Acidobacteria bacterium]|nr:hypothetical protein [Acidobacteriota bacterium]